jgi:hypothetical protein
MATLLMATLSAAMIGSSWTGRGHRRLHGV